MDLIIKLEYIVIIIIIVITLRLHHILIPKIKLISLNKYSKELINLYKIKYIKKMLVPAIKPAPKDCSKEILESNLLLMNTMNTHLSTNHCNL